MAQKYPGLIAKNSSFYFRLGLPRKLWEIARCKEICYSLNTLDYNLALNRWKTEFAHLQTFLEVFEEIVMKINSENKLILNTTDVDKVLLYRLGQIQHFLEENVVDIEQGNKTVRDIQLFSPKDKLSNPTKVQKLMANVIIDYLKGLVDSSQANITLRTTYSKLLNKEIELGLTTPDDNGQDWFKSFGTHINSLEKYAGHAVKAIKKDIPYKPTNPKVVSMLQTYDSVKTIERINSPITRTKWNKLFKRFANMKQNLKGASDYLIDSNKRYLEAVFGLLQKDYVEEITKQDCRRVSEIIYGLPKKWRYKVKDYHNIPKILIKDRKHALGKKTIKEYLNTFKEFLRYAAKEEIIPSNLNEFIDTPIKCETLIREPFTNNELKEIFNIKTYPSCKSRNKAAKFWVPIIALYQGCRLNEICQLDVDDIVMEKGLPCFYINHNKKDKSTKNEGSVRIIPIHPQIIEMGFLLYIEYQRKNHKTKLFSDLKYSGHNGYSGSIQHWFGRYLDKLEIDSPSKVFHSFRHTFETRAVEAKIPTEYQNALCGWRDSGVGQRVYGKKRDIRIMYEELCKINFPIKRELQELEKVFRDSYVLKFLNRC